MVILQQTRLGPNTRGEKHSKMWQHGWLKTQASNQRRSRHADASWREVSGFYYLMVVYEPTAIPKESHRSMFSHRVFYLTRLRALAKWGHPTPAVKGASFWGLAVTFDLLLETCIYCWAPQSHRKKSAT